MNEFKRQFKRNWAWKCLLCLLAIMGQVLVSSYVFSRGVPGNEAEAIKEDPGGILKSAFEEAKRGEENAERAEKGDLVLVNYSLSKENGELLFTNISGLTDDPEKFETDGPLEILAGQKDKVPGLHKSVQGMETGEKKDVVIPADDAYGPRMDDRVVTLSAVRKLPRKTGISLDRYIEQYRTEPEKGNIINLVPYFSHMITEITEDDILLEAMVDDILISKDDFGETRIVREGEIITLTLEPEIGAAFEVDNMSGRIVAIRENSFTVDCNNPLAGKNLVLEVEILSISKASTLNDVGIFWFEDHDEGLRFSEEYEMPAVVVLYADWCQWCKKLFDETLTDPRVTMFSDDFEWIMANSDLNHDLKKLYGQNGFPFIAIINSHGEIIRRISGFKYAYEMRDELKQALHIEGITWALKK
jgi:FKBP-type peptidyl-prolyl cis-trans isomerase 2